MINKCLLQMSRGKIKKLSTGVNNSSVGIVNKSSPQKTKFYLKKTRVTCANACEKIGNHNLPCSVQRQIRSPETTPKLPFLFGVGLNNKKKPNAGGRSRSVLNAFQRKHSDFLGV